MSHLSPEELMARLRAAREAGAHRRGSPAQLEPHRELAEACPAFVPNLLQLARSLLVSDEPGPAGLDTFAEIQRLLEHAVQASDRSAPALVELAYFHDSIHNDFHQARGLYEEGAAKALATLEDAWAGLLNSLVLEKKLQEALTLAGRAEKVFPASGRIMGAVQDARRAAVAAGVSLPENSDS
jgi:hypothetical protein